MNTLDLVNNNQVMLAITNKIAEHNLTIGIWSKYGFAYRR